MITKLATDTVSSIEIPADQNLAICAYDNRSDRAIRIRIEDRIEGAVCVQPGNVTASNWCPAVRRKHREIAPEKNFAVGLDGEGPNSAVGIRIKTIQSRLCPELRTE